MNTSPLISDNQSLVSATTQFGHAIRTYDDGYGPLFIHRDSMGINGIVRARTWEDAYSIVEDEFMPDCDLTHEELLKEYGFTREYVKMICPKGGGPERAATPEDYPLHDGQFVCWDIIDTPCDDYTENPLFQEAYGFRPNGGGTGELNKSYIYAKDLDGDTLDLLTPTLLAEWNITLEISNED